MEILEGKFKGGDSIVVDVDAGGGKMIFSATSKSAATAALRQKLPLM